MDQQLTERQSRIIEILTGESRPVAIPEIARQLQCSERTIHRDVISLRQQSIDISTVPGRAGGLLLKANETISDRSTEIGDPPTNEAYPFIGREIEIAQAEGALRSASNGTGRILMVLGEPGIGKTRFTTELVSRANDFGFSSGWGRSRDIQGAPPYWPWIQAIRALIQQYSGQLSSLLPRANRDALISLIPELSELIEDMDTDSAESGENSSFLLYDSISRLLKILGAEKPILIVLDDMHWADQASLGLLEYLSNEIESSKIMIVGTSRTIDPIVSGRVASSMSTLARLPLYSRVVLSGLSKRQIGDLIESSAVRGFNTKLLDKIFIATEGNPFFAIEINRLYTGFGGYKTDDPTEQLIPDAVRDVIERRLGNLSEGCLNILRFSAVLGYRFTFERLVAVCEEETNDSILDFLDEALRAQVVRNVPNHDLTYEFGHALIHRFLYDTMPTRRRVKTHAQIAEELERYYSGEVDTHAAELLVHFNKAKSLVGAEKVVTFAALAGRYAVKTYASEEAIAHFEIALAAKGIEKDLETADLYFDLGNALNNGSWRPTQAIDALEQAFDIYLAHGESAKAVQAASVGIVRAYGRGSAKQAELCERALKLVDPKSLDAARILIEYGVALEFEDSPDGRISALTRANTIARNYEDLFLEAKSLANLGSVHLAAGNYREVVGVISQAQQIISKIESPKFLPGLCMRTIGAALAALGETKDAKRQIADLIEHNLSLPGDAFTHVDYQLSSIIALAEGNWHEARRFADLRLSDKPSAPDFGVEAHIGFMTGASDSPIHDLSRFLDNGADFDPEEVGWNAPMLAYAGLAIGDLDAIARAEAAVTARPIDPNHLVHPLIVDIVLLLGSIVRRELTLAARLYSNLLSSRQTWSPAARLIGVDRLLALAADAAGDLEKSRCHFDDSIAFCRKAGFLPEEAWTYHDYVTFQLSNGGRIDRPNALLMLENGLAITSKLGMVPLEQRLLKLRGEVVNASEVPIYPDGLTIREIEVLKLLAVGKSNREIADELFITENTSAKHVANILSKTSSSNRVEATNYASAHNLLRLPITNPNQ